MVEMNGVTLFEMWVLYGQKIVLFQLLDYFTYEQNKITLNDSLFTTFLLLYCMHKKGPKFAPVVELAKLNFTYITIFITISNHNTKIAKDRPGFDDRPEHPTFRPDKFQQSLSHEIPSVFTNLGFQNYNFF